MKVKRIRIRYHGSRPWYKINDRNPDIIPLQNKKGSIVAVNLNYLSLKEEEKQNIADKIETMAKKKKWDFNDTTFYKKVLKNYPAFSKAIRQYKKAFVTYCQDW